MRVAWRCNVGPAVFVTVAAETVESAGEAAEKVWPGFLATNARFHAELGSEAIMRRPELDSQAALAQDGQRLDWEEY